MNWSKITGWPFRIFLNKNEVNLHHLLYAVQYYSSIAEAVNKIYLVIFEVLSIIVEDELTADCKKEGLWKWGD